MSINLSTKAPIELQGLQSTRTLVDGRPIPVLGLGVYQSTAGSEAENAVLWALQVHTFNQPFFNKSCAISILVHDKTVLTD